MKSWILLIVLAVGLTAAFTVALPFLTADSSSGPRIPAPSSGTADGPTGVAEVEGDLTHKFGVMAQESEGTHRWVFKNTGQGNLELRNLGTDCSCTIAQLGKPGSDGGSAPSVLAVKAGSSEPIELKWNTRKIDGAYRKTARIGTNDPNRPEIALAVEGTVRPAITLYPADPTINFQTVSNDEVYKRAVAIYSGDRPETVLTRVASSNPGLIGVESRPLTEEEAKSIKATKGSMIEVSLKMAPHLGAFSEKITVETDHPLAKEIQLPVLGILTGPITLTPARVFLRNVTSSNGASEALTIWVRGKTSARFTVEKKPESIDVGFEPIPQPAGSKGSKYKMTVKVIPGTPAGKISDEIVLKTDHPGASEIKVPVDILVSGTN